MTAKCPMDPNIQNLSSGHPCGHFDTYLTHMVYENPKIVYHYGSVLRFGPHTPDRPNMFTYSGSLALGILDVSNNQPAHDLVESSIRLYEWSCWPYVFEQWNRRKTRTGIHTLWPIFQPVCQTTNFSKVSPCGLQSCVLVDYVSYALLPCTVVCPASYLETEKTDQFDSRMC